MNEKVIRRALFLSFSSFLFTLVFQAAASVAVAQSAPRSRSDAYDDDADRRSSFETSSRLDAAPTDKKPIQAGELAAPDAFELDSSKSEIEKDLDNSDEKDSDRGIEFAYVAGDIGVQWLSFTAPQGGVKTSGLSLGASAGVRVLAFTLGGRFISTQARDFYSYSTSGELGLKLPYGQLEPHFLLGAGYTKVANLDAALITDRPELVERPQLGGLNLRAALGFDYFLSPTFSCGLLLSGDWIRFLSQPTVRGEPQAPSRSGAQIRSSFVLGLHI